MASGCSDCRSSARSPPTNIDASPCTRRIGRSGANQRGPGALWIRLRRPGPSSPATFWNTSAPSRARRSASRLVREPTPGTRSSTTPPSSVTRPEIARQLGKARVRNLYADGQEAPFAGGGAGLLVEVRRRAGEQGAAVTAAEHARVDAGADVDLVDDLAAFPHAQEP